ncbi:MAG: PLDc N-terminal domain-containing protein [Acidimicrobiales bacterium]
MALPGVFIVVVLLFMIVPLALIIVALVDLANRDTADWEMAGQNQIVWVLIILLVGIIGPICTGDCQAKARCHSPRKVATLAGS